MIPNEYLLKHYDVTSAWFCVYGLDCYTAQYMVCIARRIETVERSFVHRVQQFTTKQDLLGCVLACDTRYIAIMIVDEKFGILSPS
jgi:hypothetical protein